MTHQLTAESMIAAAKAYKAADQERMARRPKGYTRSTWRAENPISVDTPSSFNVLDTAYKTRPNRILFFDYASPNHLICVSTGLRPRVLEIIDLRRDDADTRLQRYRVPQ